MDGDGKRFDRSKFDWVSYQMGVIAAFAEVVGNGCKRLALSSPMTRERLDSIIDDVSLIAHERGIVLHVDEDFLETQLFDPEHTRGKHVIHIAADQGVVDEYMAMKALKRRHEEDGTLGEVENELAWGIGRLLSYDDGSIERLLREPGG
ncbi:MAG TPA: hypothetical protein VM050_10905 [Patescibacteria group bacterium]|nr:hypothetical protein [Patescibacteria group bacterium]